MQGALEIKTPASRQVLDQERRLGKYLQAGHSKVSPQKIDPLLAIASSCRNRKACSVQVKCFPSHTAAVNDVSFDLAGE